MKRENCWVHFPPQLPTAHKLKVNAVRCIVFFYAFEKCVAPPTCTNSSSYDAAAGTSETAACVSTPVASTGTASSVPTIAAPKQPAQLPSDLDANTPSQPRVVTPNVYLLVQH